MKNIFVIAEAGVNHNGDPDLAFQLVDAAVDAGADAVKFQTFVAEKIVTQSVGKASYQKRSTNESGNQLSMLKKLELSHDAHIELADYCRSRGIQFLSTAFDLDSLKFLVNVLGLKTLKISSGDLTNGPLLLAHARTGCNLILSTGMATLGEIEDALAVIAYGICGKGSPSKASFQQAYSSEDGQQALKRKVTLLHCTTEYPAPYYSVNLKAMTTMHDAFGLRVGYSDHTKGIVIPIAATARGAVLIEKHFTLDNNLPGPDHQASLNPCEFRSMVKAIRAVEQAMGHGIKTPHACELPNRGIVRKSLVAARDIADKEPFSKENVEVKRAGDGCSPMLYWDILGTSSDRSYREGEIILCKRST